MKFPDFGRPSQSEEGDPNITRSTEDQRPLQPNRSDKYGIDLELENQNRSVEKIESLPINDLEKLYLVLLLMEDKIAVDITVTLKQSDDVGKIISEIGFEFVKEEFLEKKPKVVTFYIARLREDAEKLKQAFTSSQWNDRDAGILSGYPISAVENYAKTLEDFQGGIRKDWSALCDERFIDAFELPLPAQEIQHYRPYMHFRFSRLNWEKELEVVKRWELSVALADPELYERLVKFYSSEDSFLRKYFSDKKNQ